MAAQLEDLTQELIDMRLSIEGLEKERDFYFGKLRDIEVCGVYSRTVAAHEILIRPFFWLFQFEF